MISVSIILTCSWRTGLFHGKAMAANAAVGYRFDLPSSWFVEPSVAFMYSRLAVQSLGIGLNSTSSTFGTLSFNPLLSALGRVGARVGTTYLLQSLQLELKPFLTASVWREFAGDGRTSFSTGNASISFDRYADRKFRPDRRRPCGWRGAHRIDRLFARRLPNWR